MDCGSSINNGQDSGSPLAEALTKQKEIKHHLMSVLSVFKPRFFLIGQSIGTAGPILLNATGFLRFWFYHQENWCRIYWFSEIIMLDMYLPFFFFGILK